MTEQEWLTCGNPQAMLSFVDTVWPSLRKQAKDRKLRLFSCAVERHRMNQYAAKPDSAQAVRWAMLAKAEEEADEPPLTVHGGEWFWQPDSARIACLQESDNLSPRAFKAALLRDIFGNPFSDTIYNLRHRVQPGDGKTYEFISPRLRKWLTWHDGIVVKLAQAAYDERLDDGTLDAGRLGVIADALEEAGCTEEVILRHLRGEAQEVCPACGGVGECSVEDLDGRTYHRGDCSRCSTTGLIWRRTDAPHVRGCWCLDLILGKE